MIASTDSRSPSLQTTRSPSRAMNIGRRSTRPSARVLSNPTLSVTTLPPVILLNQTAGKVSNPVVRSQ